MYVNKNVRTTTPPQKTNTPIPPIRPTPTTTTNTKIPHRTNPPTSPTTRTGPRRNPPPPPPSCPASNPSLLKRGGQRRGRGRGSMGGRVIGTRRWWGRGWCSLCRRPQRLVFFWGGLVCIYMCVCSIYGVGDGGRGGASVGGWVEWCIGLDPVLWFWYIYIWMNMYGEGWMRSLRCFSPSSSAHADTDDLTDQHTHLKQYKYIYSFAHIHLLLLEQVQAQEALRAYQFDWDDEMVRACVYIHVYMLYIFQI